MASATVIPFETLSAWSGICRNELIATLAEVRPQRIIQCLEGPPVAFYSFTDLPQDIRRRILDRLQNTAPHLLERFAASSIGQPVAASLIYMETAPPRIAFKPFTLAVA